MPLDAALTVLLIEDNPLDARTVQRALRSVDDGIEAIHATTLAHGADLAREQAVDAILLDLSLPDSEGLDSLATLLELAPATPVIVLTGLDDPEVAVAAVEQGAQDFLTKSTISPELIERALRYAIARHHSELELRQATAMVDSLHTREEIARDLHDTVIQRLFAIGMSLQAAAASPDIDQVRTRMLQAVDEIDGSIRELRQAIFGLNTAGEADGVGRAEPETLTERIQAIVSRFGAAGMHTEFDLPARLPLADGAMRDVLAILEEAVSNAVQHAQATTIAFSAEVGDRAIEITATDDGAGPSASATGAVDELRGRGLANMATRAERHGGDCTIGPGAHGGTTVTITLPRT